MKIIVELEQTDIACADENDFRALCFILQTYAKIVQTRLPDKHLADIDDMAHAWAEKKLNRKPASTKEATESEVETTAEIKNDVLATEKTETSSNATTDLTDAEKSEIREKIETELKQITFESKGKNLSSELKSILRNDYGVKKLSDLSDDKAQEILARMKKLV